MQFADNIEQLRHWVGRWHRDELRVALVPTMGALHEGHLRLLDVAREHGDRVVVSVFVNPLQFGSGEDLEAYPRDLDEDRRKLEARGTHLLFAPSAGELYPAELGTVTRIEVPGISNILCGEHRPGHFVGVATVVAKLFNMVQPQVAVFGEKDYQQLIVIRRMTAELNFPVDIVAVPTVREPDGLAMSSRNAYLTEEQRGRAPALYETLKAAAGRIAASEPDFRAIETEACQALTDAGFRPDYISIRRAADLGAPTPRDRQLVILGAAYLGRARLIDNLVVERVNTA